jgi:hypothetical protein
MTEKDDIYGNARLDLEKKPKKKKGLLKDYQDQGEQPNYMIFPDATTNPLILKTRFDDKFEIKPKQEKSNILINYFPQEEKIKQDYFFEGITKELNEEKIIKNYNLDEIVKENYLQEKNVLETIPEIYNILNQEHHQFIDYMNKGDGVEITLTPTEHQELSAEYAARIRAIQKSITPEEMNGVISMLRVGALITASAGLAGVLADKAQQVSPKLRKQTARLVEVYQNTLSTESPVGQVLESDVSGIKNAKVFAPESDDLVELNKMLIAGGACTQTFGVVTNEELEKRPAKCFAEDSKAGGSVHFLLSGNPSCSAYNRMYLAAGEEGKPFAFLDCIESGNFGRNTMQGYIDNNLTEELLGSFASSIIIANRLGLEKLAFGDLEFVDLARGLGFGERKVFNNGDSPYDAKLGYKGGRSHSDGPYLWTMGRTGSSNYRAIDPRQFNPEVLTAIAYSAETVIDRLENSKRKAIKNLKSDFEDYFSMVQQVYSDSRSFLGECADLALERIDAVADKYGFELRDLKNPVVYEAEPVEQVRLVSGF